MNQSCFFKKLVLFHMESISVLFKIVQFKAKKKLRSHFVFSKHFSKQNAQCQILKKSFIVMYIQIHAVPIRIIEGFVVVC